MSDIPKLTRGFETSITGRLAKNGSEFGLVSVLDKKGDTISGYYGITLDEGEPDEEDMLISITGSTATIIARGLDPDDPQTEVEDLKKTHRRGASLKITDYPLLAIIRNLMNAETDYGFPNTLKYASHPTISDPQHIPDKQYVDEGLNAGAANASPTVQGLVEEATQLEVDTREVTGSTGAKLFVPLDKIRATKYHDYAGDGGSTDDYAITVTPAPIAYGLGQFFLFKANTANTGSATLNVNSLGAKTIKKFKDIDLDTNDIKAGQVVAVMYDGTNMQLVSPIGKQPITQTGAEIFAIDAAGNDTYVITLSPVPAALVAGMVVRFKAGTANTGPATLNVNSLGAKTIKKHHDQDLNTGDIEANQIVEVVYDAVADVWQMNSQLGTAVTSFAGSLTTHTAIATTTNLDTTFTPNFRASVIQVYYSIQIAGATKERVGIATFSGTSIVGNMTFGGVNVDTTNVTIGNITVDANNVTASGGGSSSCTLSIQTLADDSFVIRAAIVGISSNEVTVNYYPVAFK